MKKIINGSELAGKKLEAQEDGTLRMIETSKFIPKIGELYYFIDPFGDVTSISNDGDGGDEWLFARQLVLRTVEECKEYREFIELLDEYTFKPDWKDENQQKYHIYYDILAEELCIEMCWVIKTREYSFESGKKAREFISKAGEQNIKRFMFDVWE